MIDIDYTNLKLEVIASKEGNYQCAYCNNIHVHIYHWLDGSNLRGVSFKTECLNQ